MNDPAREYRKLRGVALRNGASVFGVGRVSDLLPSFPLLSQTLQSGMTHAISIGIALSGRILDDIENAPTQLYDFHYRRINQSLDHVSLLLSSFIRREGHEAVPIPASQTIDWVKQAGHLSHKAIGQRAGHGWIGRNNLLVHPVYGSALRYATVLTEMPLPADEPVRGDCGECRRCIRACPAGAIHEGAGSFDRVACLEMLKRFSREHQIRHYICGICVKACRGPRPRASQAGDV